MISAGKLLIAAVVLIASVLCVATNALAQQKDTLDLYAPDSFAVGQ